MNRVIVVGCGLIGSSIAALIRKKNLANEVLGVDLESSLVRGENKYFHKISNSLENFGDADLLIIALPISEVPKLICYLTEGSRYKRFELITDVASNKDPILESLLKMKKSDLLSMSERFVSSHPLAGSEKGGWKNASSSLLEECIVLLGELNLNGKTSACDNLQQTSNKSKRFKLLENFWTNLGCCVVRFPIEEHDRLLSLISHFPHFLAFSTGQFLASSEYADVAQSVYGPGLRDFTRIAEAPPDLWVNIFIKNRKHILEHAYLWRNNFENLVEALEKGDENALKKVLEQSSHWRSRFLGIKKKS